MEVTVGEKPKGQNPVKYNGVLVFRDSFGVWSLGFGILFWLTLNVKPLAFDSSLNCYSTSPTVARMTSSGVVNPAIVLRIPSSRNVRIPISRARARRTDDGTFS
jgi:hypothetical protein